MMEVPKYHLVSNKLLSVLCLETHCCLACHCRHGRCNTHRSQNCSGTTASTRLQSLAAVGIATSAEEYQCSKLHKHGQTQTVMNAKQGHMKPCNHAAVFITMFVAD